MILVIKLQSIRMQISIIITDNVITHTLSYRTDCTIEEMKHMCYKCGINSGMFTSEGGIIVKRAGTTRL